MVALTRAVDVEKESGYGNTFLVEDGRYNAVFVKEELKDTKSGGKMVVLTGIITTGPHKDKEFTENLNIINSNEQAVQIAMKTIANIGKAVGLGQVTDTNQLMNKPLIIETKQKDRSYTNDSGEEITFKESQIKKYLATTSGASSNIGSDQGNMFAAPSSDIPPQPVVTQGDAANQAQATPPATNPFAAP